MKVIFWSILSLSIAFILHLVVWKIRLPERQTKTMLQLFFGTLIVVTAALFANPEFKMFGISAPAQWTEFLHISLFFTSFTLAYMITYSALEADSPSLVMTLTIAKAGGNGLSKNIFDATMTDDILVKPRIQDLLLDQMAYCESGKYKLTAKGILFARIFIFYRNLLKAQKGG